MSSLKTSSLEWPHKPHRPARLWSHACVRRSWYARFIHTVEWNDLREVSPRFVAWTFLSHHWSLAVLRQGKKPEK